MPRATDSRVCDTCGAPHAAGLIACAYCKSAYPGAQSGGVRCPRCGDINAHGNAACASCQTPLVQACLFCGRPSALDRAGCAHCGEAFAGASDRKRAREAQQKQAATMHIAEEGMHVLERAVSNSGGGGGLLGMFEELIESASKR